MKLYHFTANHLYKKIKKEGIRIGFLPLSINPVKALPGHMWLTSNDSWEQECLKGSGKLPYSRTEVRLEVHIPDRHIDKLLKFDENKDITPLYETLASKGDPENWYIYQGFIPTGWIRRVVKNV